MLVLSNICKILNERYISLNRENCFKSISFFLSKDDQDYLIKQAHVGHIIKPEWKNPTKGVQTKDVIKNYFTQLSKTQIDELYEMFR